jgi:hypothetical protein
MTNSLVDNPLLSPQREKSGAQTFQKYSYQYHWALYRLVTEHKANREYAVFIEFHEDVIIADSLSKLKVKFEFNQVKTHQQSFTENNLTKLKKGSSVLGKLLSSCMGKCYSSRIKEINLISTNGFSIPLKESGLDFEKINISKISDKSSKNIANKLKKEIGRSELPATLNFIVPNLDVKNHQSTIVGEISGMISSLFPSSFFNPDFIYRLLIDELYRKGMNQFDYESWDDSIEKKALTCNTVTKTINEFTRHKDDDKIQLEFGKIADEIGLKTIERNALHKSLIRYRNKRIGARSTIHLRTSQQIISLLIANESKCNNKISELIDIVKNKLPTATARAFCTESDLMAAIICEYLMEV